MKDYVHFLNTKARVREVYIAFDNPRSQVETPKEINKQEETNLQVTYNQSSCSLFQASLWKVEVC